MPDIPPGNLRELLTELHNLYKRAGLPGVRPIAVRTAFSHTAVYNLLSRAWTQPPNQRLVLDVAQALLAMRARGTTEREVEDTLDRLDTLWVASVDHPFDAAAAEVAPLEAQQSWAHTVRDALRDEAVAQRAYEEGRQLLAPSGNGDDASTPLPDLLETLQRAVEAARSKQAVTRDEALPAVQERYKPLAADAADLPREDAIARSRELFPFLDVAETRSPRFRRVEFRLPLSDVGDELLIERMVDLAQVLVITEEPDYVEDEYGHFETEQRRLKLYVIVRDWSDLDFYRAAEELAELHKVQLAGLKHVGTPTGLESTILTLFKTMDDDAIVATYAGVSVRQVRAIRTQAPKKLKVRTFEQALVDAQRFGIIPSDDDPPPLAPA